MKKHQKFLTFISAFTFLILLCVPSISAASINTNITTESLWRGVFSFLLSFGLFLFFFLGIAIIQIISLWKIYAKAGEHGWASLVPFYCNYVLYKITWDNGWLFLLNLIPGVNVIMTLITNYKLAKVFGKTDAFGIGMVFLPFIFIPILAFGD